MSSLVNQSLLTRYRSEIRITRATLAFSIAAWGMVTWETGEILWRRIETGDTAAIFEQSLFILLVQTLLYGNFVYQLTRLGYIRRRIAHARLPADELERLHERPSPSLSILVPTYREEISVVRRTLISAALQDYPRRRIILLVDDPPQDPDPSAMQALHATRALPLRLQGLFDGLASPFIRARSEFLVRNKKGGIELAAELEQLASLYEAAALATESLAEQCPVSDHADFLLHEKVLRPAALGHRERARAIRELPIEGAATPARVFREYARLAALFTLELASFERKRYVNLSHAPNKAMNLNSYIGLLGGGYREVPRQDGLHLEPASQPEASIQIPAADFLITLDADSVLVPEYALVLVNEMLRPGNEKLAVIQTPYNAIPGAPGTLERVAGATTDIQYLVHQGFTHYQGTYWVGANALLRPEALHDIRQEVEERGFRVPVFIHDRTVIEDTESTVDLVVHGWKLHNYPERLAFSATPADFGSLLIQRRRWANGGLIILPKLLRYLAGRPLRRARLVEGFFRSHYLGSIAAVNVGLLIALGHSFETSIESLWLPLTALPYFFLYGRDLRYSGYPVSDLVRIYALNLLLIPVNLSGVLKSIHQGITGQRIPFGRTPKVADRTRVPASHILAEYGLLTWWLIGSGTNIAHERWTSAAFALANAALLGYAIHRFIGLRESWQDICLSVPAAGRTTAGILQVFASLQQDRGTAKASAFSATLRHHAARWNQVRSHLHPKAHKPGILMRHWRAFRTGKARQAANG